MSSGELKVTGMPNNSVEMALTNHVFVHPDSAPKAKADYYETKGFVFVLTLNAAVPAGSIAMNALQRKSCKVSVGDGVVLSPWNPPLNDAVLARVTLQLDFTQKSKTNPAQMKADDIAQRVHRVFNNQVLSVGQNLVIDFEGMNLSLDVSEVACCDLESLTAGGDDAGDKAAADKTKIHLRGIMVSATDIDLQSKATKLDWGDKKPGKAKQLFVSGFNFNDIGIGGLDSEFSTIFRRAFASRVFSPQIVSKLGITHVRGMLLYGPPGTGKTMIARKIGQMLQAKPPKIVNGPEILNKYVGQSEENIRKLFAEAEAEYKERGDESDLHIIIFDEIDAICKQRGTSGGGTGVGDTVVNQLLSKMDGVDSLNNILVIGMTNRKDMIDEALLRPGRLEVHMEIGLPDEVGRLQILKIHTKKMLEGGFLSKDVDLAVLAREIKNFSGADIEGLCKAATGWAFNRQVDITNIKKQLSEKDIKVTMEDFERAREEVVPTYAVNPEEFESRAPNGIMNYGPRFVHLQREAKKFIDLVRASERAPLFSFCLDGPTGSGKTAFASDLAMASGFPYTKFISAEQFVGASESYKCQKIAKVFDDAYKTPLSCVVIDDVERLLEYVPMGQRFSNVILQTLLVSLKRAPPKGRRILIISTTSSMPVLHEMGLNKCFTATLNIRPLDGAETESVLKQSGAFHSDDVATAAALITHDIPIKKLLTAVEMARSGSGPGKDKVALDTFEECLTTLGDQD